MYDIFFKDYIEKYKRINYVDISQNYTTVEGIILMTHCCSEKK